MHWRLPRVSSFSLSGASPSNSGNYTTKASLGILEWPQLAYTIGGMYALLAKQKA